MSPVAGSDSDAASCLLPLPTPDHLCRLVGRSSPASLPEVILHGVSRLNDFHCRSRNGLARIDGCALKRECESSVDFFTPLAAILIGHLRSDWQATLTYRHAVGC